MYNLLIKDEADKIFKKLSKKYPAQLKKIGKKITEIRKNPFGYNYLRKPLNGYNRVHIDKHFVLVFKIQHDEKTVEIYYFEHHDKIYKWQP